MTPRSVTAELIAFGTVLAVASARWAIAAEDLRHSGFDDMSPATQAMQRDDDQNPAMLWVQDGQALWSKRPAAGGQSCADCHGDAAVSQRGVAARYPAFDDALNRPLSLNQRIAECRRRYQPTEPPMAPESHPLLSLEAYLAMASRGLPIAPPADPRLDAYRELGRQWFTRRIGQLNLACTQCHDDRAGQRLGGSLIPQAHPTAYPEYRLEWQTLGSLQRRIRNCMSGVRAEPIAFGAVEMTAIELFLAQRAAGMQMEGAGVRP
jgi:sulfur-oxidizing protein SoxA